jgi:hypothetical protein
MSEFFFLSQPFPIREQQAQRTNTPHLAAVAERNSSRPPEGHATLSQAQHANLRGPAVGAAARRPLQHAAAGYAPPTHYLPQNERQAGTHAGTFVRRDREAPQPTGAL